LCWHVVITKLNATYLLYIQKSWRFYCDWHYLLFRYFYCFWHIICINQWEWLKWLPINMLNLSSQIIDNEMMKSFTKLELHELFIGNIVYIVVFLALVILVFKKKNV